MSLLTSPSMNRPVQAERFERWLSNYPDDGIACPKGEPFALGTKVGNRSENQDRVVAAKFLLGGVPAYLGLLLDGMGGMQQGARCANIAAAAFLAELIPPDRDPPGRSPPELLQRAALAANHAVFNVFRGQGGAACVATLTTSNQVHGISAGDCRAYSFRHDGAFRQLTFDDTLAAHVAAARGTSVERDARNELVQFIGIGPDLMLHEFGLVVEDGTRGLLLTSDGAHRLPTDEFTSAVRDANGPRELVEALLTGALGHGAHDNATALSFAFREKGPSPSVGTIEFWDPANALEIWLVAYGRAPFYSVDRSSAQGPVKMPVTASSNPARRANPGPADQRDPKKKKKKMGDRWSEQQELPDLTPREPKRVEITPGPPVPIQPEVKPDLTKFPNDRDLQDGSGNKRDGTSEQRRSTTGTAENTREEDSGASQPAETWSNKPSGIGTS